MQITPQQLKQKIQNKENILLLDVRSPAEYANWSIQGSVNIPLQMLTMKLNDIPKDKEIITICSHGMRSARATEILQSLGYNAKTVFGGMAAWNTVYDLVPLIDKDIKLFQIKRVGKGCLGYIIISKGHAAIIDPSANINEYLEMANRFNCKITGIIDTHQHADHVSGSRLLQQETNGKLFINSKDGYNFSGFQNLSDNKSIVIGDATIEVLETPGHTPGSTSLMINNEFLLTGDALFIDGIARPDLKDKSEEYAGILYDTHQNKILNLSDKIKILPAHCRDASILGWPVFQTLDSIVKNNRVFELSKNEFVKYVVANIPMKPQNYEHIIAANKGELDLTEDEIMELEFGANRCVLPTK